MENTELSKRSINEKTIKDPQGTKLVKAQSYCMDGSTHFTEVRSSQKERWIQDLRTKCQKELT